MISVCLSVLILVVFAISIVVLVPHAISDALPTNVVIAATMPPQLKPRIHITNNLPPAAPASTPTPAQSISTAAQAPAPTSTQSEISKNNKVAVDKFGIREIYPTKSNGGREWYVNTSAPLSDKS